MFSKTKLFAVALLAAGILTGSFLTVSAQETQEKIKVSKKEETAINKIDKAKTIDEKMKLIADFIKEFPQSPARKQVVEHAAQQVTQLTDDSQVIQHGNAYLAIFPQPEDADLVLPNMIFSYVQLKRLKDAFDAAQTYLARHPEDVRTRLTLVIEGSNAARTGNGEFVAPTREYAVKAIELIEADKRPANLNETQWQEYKTNRLPQLYQSLGFIELSSGNNAKARTYLEKAVALDAKDVNSWVLLGSMIDEEYQSVAVKYNAAAPGAERDALLKQANEKIDAVIEVFARVVALTEGKPEAKQLHDQARESLENYYKYRHKNTDGLRALIDKYKN